LTSTCKFKKWVTQRYISIAFHHLSAGTSLLRNPSIALRYLQYLCTSYSLFLLNFSKEIEMAKWMMPIAAALVLAACDMGGQETDTFGTSGGAMGTTSGASDVDTMPSYPTGVSSGASDVGSTSSSGAMSDSTTTLPTDTQSRSPADSSGSTESASDGIITKDQPLQ
jgi:hypothetical protein